MEIPPEILIQAYRSGVFPMAESRYGEIYLCEPEQRGILEFDDLRVSRSLRKLVRSDRFSVTVNRAFADVIDACADRDETWISIDLESSYIHLHELGYAHSVEVWQGDELAGGLYGVVLGSVFCGESMFHRVRDASKVALVYLVNRLRERGFTMLDVQLINPHLASLGATEISQQEYVQRLHEAMPHFRSFDDDRLPDPLWFG